MRVLIVLLTIALITTACTPYAQGPNGRGMMGSGIRDTSTTTQTTAIAGSYETTSPQLLPVAKSPAVVVLKNGDTYTMTAEKVRKEIAGRTITMYGYNGMIPGPLFVVEKGTNATITFENKLDKETTVHWHGLRGDYRFDGTPGLGQYTVRPGESFSYSLEFPDDGVYWYHPHVREDAQQDLGLYGNIFVNGLDTVAGSADRKEYLVLDDIALTQTGVEPFGATTATHAIMGRYGNVLLVNGETDYATTAQTGEVVRLYFTNVANVRPFHLSIPGAQIKLVGGDNGAYLKQVFVEDITIAPAERYVVDVLFEKPGTYELRADNPLARHLLGTITVSEGEPTAAGTAFADLKENAALANDLVRLKSTIDGPVDRSLELDFQLPGRTMPGSMTGMMQDTHDGIEWEDTMPMMSSFMSDQIEWIIRDKQSGLENDKLTIRATVGDVEKWRIEDKGDSMHPMQHPIHLHGQRFLVTAIDGKPVDNVVWKDTVLVPIGHSVDIIVEYTNPGEWMLHCHIAEHLETGMFAYVSVANADGTTAPRIGEMTH